MAYSKRDMILIIQNAAKIYENELYNKNRLIAFGSPNKPEYIQTKATKKNFCHLTGVILNETATNTLDLFYQKAIDKNLSPNDFEINPNGTTQLKMDVIKQALNISKNAKMIGDYNGTGISLKTDKITGNNHSCIGFLKTGKYYSPNTILNGDTRKYTTDDQRVLCILSKTAKERQYSKIDYAAKGIDIDKLLSKISQDVPIDNSLFQNNASTAKTTQSSMHDIVDNLNTISSDDILSNSKALVDLYNLSKTERPTTNIIYQICNENNLQFGSFDAFVNRKPELQTAYDKHTGVTNDLTFDPTYERLERFIEPFQIKSQEPLVWSIEKCIWEHIPDSPPKGGSKEETTETINNKPDAPDKPSDNNPLTNMSSDDNKANNISLNAAKPIASLRFSRAFSELPIFDANSQGREKSPNQGPIMSL